MTFSLGLAILVIVALLVCLENVLIKLKRCEKALDQSEIDIKILKDENAGLSGAYMNEVGKVASLLHTMNGGSNPQSIGNNLNGFTQFGDKGMKRP